MQTLFRKSDIPDKVSAMHFGLHFIYPLHSPTLSKRDIEILSIVKPAGVFLDARSFSKDDYPAWLNTFSELRLQVSNAIGREKIIFAIDHEGGRINRLPAPVSRTPFAGAFAPFADRIGEIHGEELSALGINLNFAPVADINSNPSNPVIGPRAFGNTPDSVATAICSYTRALQSHGVYATWKHFPGHGDTETDSHHSFPSVNISAEDLYSREMKVYENLATNNLRAIMTAHVRYPALDSALPASLSKNIINGVLREKLKFNGLVISDDMDMRAITDNFADEDIIRYFCNSGADLMLFNHNPERLLKCYEILKSKGKFLEDSQQRINSFLNSLNSVTALQIPECKFFSENQNKVTTLTKKSSSINFLGTEPEPPTVKPPKSEFNVRIGIVLEEDSKSFINFTPTENSELIDRGSVKLNLQAGKNYQITVKDNQLYLNDSAKKIRLETIATIKTKKQTISPCVGTKIEGIVAGRHFHWKKEITEVFPGDIELIPSFDKIIAVNIVNFEDYVICVVGSEMSGKGLPPEFAKAQAIAARTWSYVFMGNKYPGEPYTLCNDDMSQRYQGSTHITNELIKIISQTRGEFLTDEEGCLCPCYYSKSTGGHGELSENCFGFHSRGIGASYDCPDNFVPALNLSNEEDFSKWLRSETWQNRNIFCSPEIVPENELKKFIGAVDVADSYFRWEYKLSADTLINNLKSKFGIEASSITNLIPGKRGVSGRFLDFSIKYISNDKNENTFKLPTQFAIRAAFHESFLFSSAFVFELEQNSTSVTSIKFSGAGWGHGVGLCQIGALGMALMGYDYKKILRHYFSTSSIKSV
jgi:SpoIID/LytB domain protein